MVTIGINVDGIIDEVGDSGRLYAFFSTVAYRLEGTWGAKFPVVMRQLYEGRLPAALARQALTELVEIRAAFEKLGPEALVWRFEEPEWAPPEDRHQTAASPGNLADCFIAPSGRKFFDLMDEALEALLEAGRGDLKLEKIDC
ncbi:MAG: hypothetical protein H7A21_09565 [Spirochaetales bacterium]|nr:hypothetical protein [Spirochaetales bacterium]